MEKKDQQVLVISSHVVRGSVGSRTTVTALETMGFAAWVMLTVSMTWQPAHGPSHRLNVSPEDFAGFAEDIKRTNWTSDLASVMTGYFVYAEQVTIAAQLIRHLKARHPELVFVCDPVLGDEAGLYVPENVALAIKEELIPLADIVKPNRSELEWIVGRELPTNRDIIEAARSLNKDRVLVTSAWGTTPDKTANLLMFDGELVLAEHQRFDRAVTGLGDMTAALFTGHILHGVPAREALSQTTGSVAALLQKTVDAGTYELMIEHMRDVTPKTDSAVSLHVLDEPSADKSSKVQR